MKSKIFILLSVLLLVSTAVHADSKKVKDLKNQKAKIERGIQQSKNELQKTRQQTVKKEQTADFIEDQLQNRLEYIHRLETEIDTLQANVERLEKEVAVLEEQVNGRKQKYITSLRQARQATYALLQAY